MADEKSPVQISHRFISISCSEMEIPMKIIKRSGAEVQFDIRKISAAVKKANEGVIDSEKLTNEQIEIMRKHLQWLEIILLTDINVH